MYYVNNNKYFDSMTEAKMSLLHHLKNLDQYRHLVERIKTSIENHENINELMVEIEPELTGIADKDHNMSKEFQEDIRSIKVSVYDILPLETMNRNPILGAVDTFLPVQLLLNPTNKMLDVTRKISSSIISTLRQYQKNNFDFNGTNLIKDFESFAQQMIFESSKTYPGTLKLEEVNKRIAEFNKTNTGIQIQEINPKKNPFKMSPEQINVIIDMSIERLESRDASLLVTMAIHCSYGYTLLKTVPMASNDISNINMDSAMDKVLGHYRKTYSGSSIQDFYHNIRSVGATADASRRFISDDMMYDTSLYKAESSRGRTEDQPTIKKGMCKTYLGVIRGNMPAFLAEINIPEKTVWVDWTQSKFESNSIIVSSMATNETPFISSYSGTTSLLSSLMIQSNTLDSLQEKQIYIQSILAYISSAGYHSVHEILAPLAYCLEMIPLDKYPVEPATDNGKGLPPLYSNFYQIAEANDPDFSDLRNKSWDELILWYENTYVSHYEEFLKYENVTNLSRIISLIKNYNHADSNTKPLLLGLLTDLLKYSKQENSADITSALEDYTSGRSINDEILRLFNDLIPDDVKIHNLISELNSKCDAFSFKFSDNELQIIARWYLSASGYSVKHDLSKHTEKIENILKAMRAPDELVNHLLNIAGDPTHSNAEIHPITKKMARVFTNNPEMISQFKICLNNNITSVQRNNDWVTACTAYTTDNDRYSVINHANERQHMIILDKDDNTIIKLLLDHENYSAVHDNYSLQKVLFEKTNGAEFKFEINNGIVKVSMQNLGISLNNIIQHLSVDDLENVEQQALALLTNLHNAGYVHGDVRLDNFVYDKKTKKLSLIDFETSTKIIHHADGKPYARLKIINTNTTSSIDDYEPEFDLILAKGIFLSARNKKILEQTAAHTAVNTLDGSYAQGSSRLFKSGRKEASTAKPSVHPSPQNKQ